VALKVLCAGCSKDEREQAELAVRQALGKRADGGAWTVSLVRIANQWSVTLDGPAQGVPALTLVAPGDGLREAIVTALGKPAESSRGAGVNPAPLASGGAGKAPQTPAAPSPAQSKAAASSGPCQCEKCGEAFVVVYDAAPDEAEETVAVACPHCWKINHVLVGETAAETRDYRAEKA
jgi:hypothetical protein